MIPKYPKFTKLKISHQDEFIKLIEKFDSYSDFNFVSLYCWGEASEKSVSLLNNNLIIKMPGYLDSKPLYTLIGNNKIDETLEELSKKIKKLELVPEVVVDKITSKKFIVKENRDNFDYIYDLENLSKLQGKRYKKYRNKVNSFIKSQAGNRLEIRVETSIDAEQAQNFRHITLKWRKANKRTEGDTLAERNAIFTLIKNADKFNLLVVSISINDEVVAFSINEKLKRGQAVCHFEKAPSKMYTNIYCYLINQTAIKLLEHGCKIVNWEQDLGLEGLRATKSRWQPTDYLKKYDVRIG